ncbi:protein SRG1 isoform X2 [Ziziphus jujuba]|uniref:Protein SRG1 isoform X2 n=1 Tax=Ziziphus jujuba TaxID=326968 RepID=A0ABM3ZVJ4_ZIZJJ|nr:protein SRG1 isoform X2 [Ziziphus jujuba]
MEENKSIYGSSLLVPSVQELVKKEANLTVPSRYNQLLLSLKISTQLARIGVFSRPIFQLVNHEVSSSLVEKIKTDIQEFFNLPMEEKKKFWQNSGEVEGFGQAFVVSEQQKLDWNDIFLMTTLPVHMRKPHLFPKLPSPFRETLETYSLELKNLAMRILEQMEKALKVKAKEVTELFEGGLQAMRMNYYPPCPEPEQVIGLAPHSDAAGLTILLQVSEVEGLQIKKDGMWAPVKPLPNAFIVNIGDFLEIITNGEYRSIEHRVTINSSDKERLSIATFYSPRFDGEMGPAYSLVNDQSPQKYRRIGVQEFYRDFFKRELDGKSFIDSMRL